MKDSKRTLDGLLNDEGLKTMSPWDNPEVVEYMRGVAKLSKVKYDELIKQGFSEDQALELCKNLLSMK
jgi:hypothetical protein